MQKILLAIFLALPILGNAQGLPFSPLDTMSNVGVIKDYCKAGLSVIDCIPREDVTIPEGALVVIAGARSCKYPYSASIYNTLDIFYQNKPYHIDLDKVIIEDHLFDEIVKASGERKVKFRKEAEETSLKIQIKELSEALDYVKKLKPKGLGLLSWSYDESDVLTGIDISFNVLNPTNKTIKYIWFNVVGYNPVGDKVIDPLKRTALLSLRAVGPIAPDEHGTYYFERAWHTNLVDTVKIISIKVQHMDGSIKTITDIKSITMPDKYYDTIQNASH